MLQYSLAFLSVIGGKLKSQALMEEEQVKISVNQSAVTLLDFSLSFSNNNLTAISSKLTTRHYFLLIKIISFSLIGSPSCMPTSGSIS
jgi:hypothetical protein